MVKQPTRIQIIRNHYANNERRGSICNSVIKVWCNSLTVHPINPKDIDNSYMVLFIYLFMLGCFNCLALVINMFLPFHEDKLTINDILVKFGVFYSIFLISLIIVSFLFTWWAAVDFSPFIILIFASGCSGSPLITLLKSFGFIQYIISFLFVLIMSYYVQVSLYGIYTPQNQRESIIQNSISFISLLLLFQTLRM